MIVGGSRRRTILVHKQLQIPSAGVIRIGVLLDTNGTIGDAA